MKNAAISKLWCEHIAHKEFFKFARVMAPLETGGCLAGYYASNSTEVVITNVIGPGPNARHRRTSFIPDRKYHDLVLSQLWAKSNHTIRYIGDWHTHPGGMGALSTIDKQFMKHALSSRQARLPYSLVAIVYGDLTNIQFWYLSRTCIRFGMLSLFKELQVIEYT